jgi:hypothetical protein
MLRISRLLVLICAIGGTKGIATAQQSSDDLLYQEIIPKTVRIHVTGTAEQPVDENGTGFFIDSTHILTAAHVFGEKDWVFMIDGRENHPTVDLELPNARGLLTLIPNQNSGATLVAQNRALDLALIAVDGNSAAVSCADLDIDNVNGRPFRAIGWRPGLSTPDKIVQPTDGSLDLAPAPDGGSLRWRFSLMSASEGNSGGPVFNGQGNVIAVVTSGRNKRLAPGQSETFATPIRYLKTAFPGQGLDSCFNAKTGVRESVSVPVQNIDRDRFASLAPKQVLDERGGVGAGYTFNILLAISFTKADYGTTPYLNSITDIRVENVSANQKANVYFLGLKDASYWHLMIGSDRPLPDDLTIPLLINNRRYTFHVTAGMLGGGQSTSYGLALVSLDDPSWVIFRSARILRLRQNGGSFLELVLENQSPRVVPIMYLELAAFHDWGSRCAQGAPVPRPQEIHLEWPKVLSSRKTRLDSVWTKLNDESVAVDASYQAPSCGNYTHRFKAKIPVQMDIDPKAMLRTSFKIQEDQVNVRVLRSGASRIPASLGEWDSISVRVDPSEGVFPAQIPVTK